MKKSEIIAKEKLIIENFAKVFNSIKRIDENGVNEYDEVQVGDTYLVLQPFSILPSIKSTTMIPPIYAKEDGSFPFEKGEKISVKDLVELNGIKTVYFQKTIDFFYFHTAPVGFFEKAVTEGKLQKLG